MRRIDLTAVGLALGVLCWFAHVPAGAQAAAGGGEQAVATAFHQKLVDQYMHNDWAELEASLKASAKHTRYLTATQRTDVTYIRKAYRQHRPSWWKSTKSSKNISFRATIWGKPFMANYMPSGMMGVQYPVDIDERTGKFRVIVSWQPHKIDSTKESDSSYERSHLLTEGDHAECTVWHELGHNYVTECLPASQIMAIYRKYHLLLESLQEFYADMTALYHCGPQGRKATLFIRQMELRWNDVDDSHTRAAHAIGSWLLAHVLMDKAKWPSFRLPTRAPTKDVERSTILYMYQHLHPDYTLQEDRALRELAGRLVRTQGASVLRKKGLISLPNGLAFQLLTADDTANQVKRDAWVKERLTKAIASGQVTKAVGLKSHPRKFRIKVAW
jgi:hypothetical protein